MEKLDNFKGKIKPQFKKLEASRKARYMLYLTSYSLYIIPVVIFLVAVNYPEKDEKSYVPLLGILLSLGLLVGVIPYVIKSQSKSYIKKFKQQILENFIGALYPDIYYSIEKEVGKEVRDSKLFRSDFENLLGEDYLSGMSRTNLNFQFSRLKFSLDMGQYKSPYSFDGVFFVFEVPEMNFPEILVISKAEDEFDSYSALSSLNSIKTDLRKVQIGRISPRLNKLCNFYAIDEEACYKVLNSDFTKTLDFFVKNKTKIFRISFYKNRVYVALNEVRDLFKVDISASIDGDILINRIYKELKECIYIANNFSQAINTLGEISFKEKEEGLNENGSNDDLPYDHLIDFD
jgi:hypothetical protein